MRSELQSEYEGSASLQLITPPWAQPEAGSPALRIRSSVARGIAGRLSGIADLLFLSLTLIYFALWAVEARPAVDPFALLSMRMSIGHFCMLGFCWIIWRAIFFYCGLYTWQHIQSVQSILGRVLLATGVCALVEAQVIASQWHHGHFLQIMLYTWVVSALCALGSRAGIGAFHVYIRPYLRRTRNAVIVGGGTNAVRISKELKSHAESEL